MTCLRVIQWIKRKTCLLLFNSVFSGITRCWKIKRRLLIWAGFDIGTNTKIVGPVTITGQLTIGENTWVGTDFKVYGNGRVIIGNNCDIAPDVAFLTGSHEIGSLNRRAGAGKSLTIQVKNGAWIGARSTLVGNIVIHESSIIGAGALVNRDVERNTLAGGVPAKVLKKLSRYSNLRQM